MYKTWVAWDGALMWLSVHILCKCVMPVSETKRVTAMQTEDNWWRRGYYFWELPYWSCLNFLSTFVSGDWFSPQGAILIALFLKKTQTHITCNRLKVANGVKIEGVVYEPDHAASTLFYFVGTTRSDLFSTDSTDILSWMLIILIIRYYNSNFYYMYENYIII